MLLVEEINERALREREQAHKQTQVSESRREEAERQIQVQVVCELETTQFSNVYSRCFNKSLKKQTGGEMKLRGRLK